jgi:pSer/pThr/pTyr-binding forkhead associated (FHA) protein
MIQCEICGAEFYPGTLFCKECGGFLLDGSQQGQLQESTHEQFVHYLIPSSSRQGKLDLSTPIWIGRADLEAEFKPQLDLTGDKGMELGVSRRHALIRKDEKELVLIDQRSVNGTWVNQERLVPEQPFPLPPTTQVRFGRLLVIIILE